MTIAVCGVCNVEMIPLPLGTHINKALQFKCPNCNRIVDWTYPETKESEEI